VDLSLIEGGGRAFGYDNLGDWHCHPPEAPDRHVACGEPAIEDFIRTAVTLSPKT